jgi:hypothetical protein
VKVAVKQTLDGRFGFPVDRSGAWVAHDECHHYMHALGRRRHRRGHGHRHCACRPLCLVQDGLLLLHERSQGRGHVGPKARSV